jgi:nucleoside-diphosphate-sugar epimerase
MGALIVGGAGLVGTALAQQLAAAGTQVCVADNFRSSRGLCGPRQAAYQNRLAQVPETVEFVEADVRDDRTLSDVIAASDPSLVYYLAALLASESEEHPDEAWQVQVEGLRTVVELLEERREPVRIVSASSSFIYGDFQYSPADEEHPLRPTGVYGRAKLAGESYLRGRELSFGRWMVLRPSSVYGIGDPRDRFASVAIEQAVTTGRFSCAYPGFISDFTYVADTAGAFALAGGDGFRHGTVLNVSRGTAWTTEQFCEVVRQAVPGSTYHVEDWSGVAPRRGALDNDAARRVLGWHAGYDLRSGVLACIDAVKSVFPGIGGDLPAEARDG